MEDKNVKWHISRNSRFTYFTGPLSDPAMGVFGAVKKASLLLRCRLHRLAWTGIHSLLQGTRLQRVMCASHRFHLERKVLEPTALEVNGTFMVTATPQQLVETTGAVRLKDSHFVRAAPVVQRPCVLCRQPWCLSTDCWPQWQRLFPGAHNCAELARCTYYDHVTVANNNYVVHSMYRKWWAIKMHCTIPAKDFFGARNNEICRVSWNVIFFLTFTVIISFFQATLKHAGWLLPQLAQCTSSSLQLSSEWPVLPCFVQVSCPQQRWNEWPNLLHLTLCGAVGLLCPIYLLAMF